MIDFTIAICTFNGARRIPKVLDHLCIQKQKHNINWEVLIIDNNSQDHTVAIAAQYQQHWAQPYPLRYCFEPRQGLAYARRLAVKEARGEWIGFLDDDNWPSSDWLEVASDFIHTSSRIGAFGGKILADYEIDPPSRFQEIACFLGIIDRGDHPFRYDLLDRWLFPAGAGIIIRREAWINCVPENFMLTGVSSTSMLAKGEDIETLSYIRQGGWEVWHVPTLVIYHHISKNRLSKDYLIKLFQGVGLSRYITRKIRLSGWQDPVFFLLYAMSDCCKLVIHWLRHFSTLHHDLVARCQLELLLFSLISPIYHWQKKIQSKLMLDV